MSLNASIKSVISQIDKRGDISRETLDYFLISNPKFGRNFYLINASTVYRVDLLFQILRFIQRIFQRFLIFI